MSNDVDDWRGGMEVWTSVGYFELSSDDWIELVDMSSDNSPAVVEVDPFSWSLVIFSVNARLKQQLYNGEWSHGAPEEQFLLPNYNK